MPLQHGDAEDASGHALRLGLELDGDLLLSLGHLLWNLVLHLEELARRVAVDRLRGKLLIVDQYVERSSAVASPIGAKQRYRFAGQDLDVIADPSAVPRASPVQSPMGSGLVAAELRVILGVLLSDGDAVDGSL